MMENKILEKYLLYLLDEARRAVQEEDVFQAMVTIEDLPSLTDIGALEWLLSVDSKQPCPFCGGSLIFPTQYLNGFGKYEHRCSGAYQAWQNGESFGTVLHQFEDGCQVLLVAGEDNEPMLYHTALRSLLDSEWGFYRDLHKFIAEKLQQS